MVEVSLLTEMVVDPVLKAVTDYPVTPELPASIVLVWLVNVPPLLMLYSRLVPAFKVPLDNPVAAKKLP